MEVCDTDKLTIKTQLNRALTHRSRPSKSLLPNPFKLGTSRPSKAFRRRYVASSNAPKHGAYIPSQLFCSSLSRSPPSPLASRLPQLSPTLSLRSQLLPSRTEPPKSM